MRTQSLFISAKFSRMKSIASLTVPSWLTSLKEEIDIFNRREVSTEALIPFLDLVRQQITGTLQKVVPKKQASQRMLYASTHLHQIFHDVFAAGFAGFDVYHSDRDKKIPGRMKTAGFGS